MEEISLDTNKYCFMINDTIKALEMSALETLIIWENLNINCVKVLDKSTNNEDTLFLTPKQEENDKILQKEDGTQLKIIERTNMVEWIAENYKKYGVNLEIVTDKTQEGNQFCKGFGGIGGILRWKIDFSKMEVEVNEDYNEEYNSNSDEDLDNFI